MNRLEQLRQVVDEIVRKNPDQEQSRCGFVHLYGVSAVCTILALKRDLNVELCSAAGMLHDIWNYQERENHLHDQLGAVEARKILEKLGSFTPSEVDIICTAIATHGDKKSIHGEMAELLKDADVFQHYLYNPAMYINSAQPISSLRSEDKARRIERLEGVLAELGIRHGLQVTN
jgi:uncharacterized protein